MPAVVPAWWSPSAPGMVSRVEVWSQGEQVTDDADIVGGSVTEKRGTGQRMTLDLLVLPTSQWLRWLELPRLEFRVWSGFSRGTSEFLVPLGRFPVLPPGQALPRDQISVQAEDYWSWVVNNRFTYPRPSYGGKIRDVAERLVRESLIGPPSNTLSDSGFMARVVWDNTSAHDIIAGLMTDVAGEAFVDREGTPILRDRQVAEGDGFRSGENLIGIEFARDFGNIANYVSVVPQGSKVDFSPVTVQVEDPDHPAHPSKIGMVGRTYSSPHITSRSQALGVARSLVERWSRPVKRWTVTALPDPARMVGDRVPLVSALGGVHAVINEVVHSLVGEPMRVTLGAT